MNMIPLVGNVLTTVVESSISAEKKMNALEALSCCLEATSVHDSK